MYDNDNFIQKGGNKMCIEERIAQLEFEVELLFNNSPVDRFVFESKISREQYNAIMDIFDSFRNKLDAGQAVHHYDFERRIYEIVPEKNGDYNFCELIAKLFAEQDQWDEVFTALYGTMMKYQDIS